MLWRLDNGEIDGIQPKAALVMIGTNNLGAKHERETLRASSAIVKKAEHEAAEDEGAAPGHLPAIGTGRSPIADRIKEINAEIAKLDDGKTVFFKNIGGRFLAEDGSLRRPPCPTSCTFRADAYRTWADAVEEELERLMKSE